mgnify:CR=1 FL=1
MIICMRCYVAGRVQGVFYRATTQQKARELGISGYARNRDDGRVEVLACGESDQVQRLCDWLWQGSSGSVVKAVECEEISANLIPHQFNIN